MAKRKAPEGGHVRFHLLSKRRFAGNKLGNGPSDNKSVDLSVSSTFEDAAAKVKQVLNVRGGSVIFQYNDLYDEVASVENQSDWESFMNGPCKLLKKSELVIRVVSKKAKKPKAPKQSVLPVPKAIPSSTGAPEVGTVTAPPAKTRPRGVCFAWQKGDCTRGDACRFAHSEEAATDAPATPGATPATATPATPGAAPAAGTPVAQAKKKRTKGGPKPLKNVVDMNSYKKANFRGALQEYFQRAPTEAKISFSTEAKMAPPNRIFISKCTVEIGETVTEGTGHAPSKKPSIQFAALDAMFKLNLLTKVQYENTFETKEPEAATPAVAK